MMSATKTSDPTRIDQAEISFFQRIQSILVSSPKYNTRVRLQRSIRRICGADAFYTSEGNRVTAVASLLSKDSEVLETYTYRGHFTYPYVSGLFYLHEGPFVTYAVLGLKVRPDLVCFDAHGMAHPRQAGLATICGIILGIPSIGIAKSKLAGEIEPYKPGLEKIVLQGMTVGFLTRFQGAKKYWSPGFAVSIKQLELIIENHSETCIKSIAEADQVGRSS